VVSDALANRTSIQAVEVPAGGLGHLPKYDDRSSRAWLYGKLLIALLTQKLIRIGREISPWGYYIPSPIQPVA